MTKHEGFFKAFIDLFRFRPLEYLAKTLKGLLEVEFKTDEGRLNAAFMMLSALLLPILSVSPLFEAIVRVFRPTYSLGFPLIQVLLAVLAANLTCIFIVGYLNRRSP